MHLQNPVLTQKNLPGLSAVSGAVQVPTYLRQNLAVGVVHLGLGAFQRAHQALVYDALLAKGDTRWGVLGVAMRSTALADSLAAQDGLYTVQVASRDGRRWQVAGAIVQTCVAARDRQQVLDTIAAPTTRWLTLTVTEKAYGPELAALIVDGLRARHQAGLGGLTVASCDNLTGNGDKLRRLCLDAAADTALAAWITDHCAFPNSMVDRIVPASTAQHRAAALEATGLDDICALGTEAFWEWVIENRLADPADAAVLAAAGVTVVDDVLPFEQAKLCMLNGSHTAIAVIGAVMGLPTVSDCVAHPAIHAFMVDLMTDVMMPQLTRPGLPMYRDALLERFANPELRHQVHQIASDSSLKIPLRWGGTITARRQAGLPVEPLALAAAVWMRYLLGEDEQGKVYAMSDPMAHELKALAVLHRGDPAATVPALMAIRPIWGEVLPHDTDWMARVTFWLERVQAVGVGAALIELRTA